MTKDWSAVAAAVRERMQQLDINQAELIQRSGLAPMTVREIVNDTARRRRSQATLAALAEALGLPRAHLLQVLEGKRPRDPDHDDPVLRELTEVRADLETLKESEATSQQLRDISTRLERIERLLSPDD